MITSTTGASINTTRIRLIVAAAFSSFLLHHSAFAQAPSLLNYQGRLLDGTNLVNGMVNLKFNLFVNEPDILPVFQSTSRVAAVDGLYDAFIGDNVTLGSLASALTNSSLYLEVVVNNTALTPRERIASVAYALHAINSAKLGGLSAGAFATGTPLYVFTETDPLWSAASNGVASLVTNVSARLASNTWAAADSTTNFLPRTGGTMSGALQLPSAGLSVGVTQLLVTAAGNLVTTGTVFAAGFSGSGAGLTALSGSSLDAGSVTGAAIADGAITAAKLATGAVDSAGVADGSISALDVNVASFSTTFWSVGGNAGTVTGSHFLGTADSSPLEIRVNNLRAGLIAPVGGAPNIVLGAAQNTISNGAVGSAILGGSNQVIDANSDYSSIGGGFRNQILGADDSVIAGGQANIVQGDPSTFAFYHTIGGGFDNLIWGTAGTAFLSPGGAGTIAGGNNNTIETNADFAAIGGGYRNTIRTNADFSVIAGGAENRILPLAQYATIAGGQSNAAASFSFAAGRRAKANHTGTFVWADSQDADFASSGNNTFLIRASGGVGIGTTTPDTELHIQRGPAGTVTANSSALMALEGSTNTFLHFLVPTNAMAGILFGDPANSLRSSIRVNNNGADEMTFRVGDNTTKMTILTNGFVGIGTTSPTNLLHVNGTVQALAYITGSDRNMKENIQQVDPGAILDKVATLPIATWTFKQEPNGTHIGPMAQDFHAAFGFGNTDTGIMTVDADGVALAAIQALARRNADLEKMNEELKREIEAIKTRLGME